MGSRGKAPAQEVSGFEAGGILMSDAKNKIETENIHSNKSQVEKTGGRAEFTFTTD